MEKEPSPTPVFALATTSDSTRHAVSIARALADRRHVPLTIVAALPERITVSSARAHAYNVTADEWNPDPIVSPDFARAMAAGEAPGAQVVVGKSMEPPDVSTLLPNEATVVVSGPARHWLKSPEQRLARGLARRGFDVVFLPSRERSQERAPEHDEAD